jgi:GT2 family glycosyltransferase
VLLLNNDTLVEPSMLTELVRVAEENPCAMMIGPTVYCENEEGVLFAAGSFVDWRQGRVRHRGMYESTRTVELPSTPERVDFIAGCAVLVRSSMLGSVGLLERDYFLNFEDVDWATRARAAGLDVLYAPSARMWHKVSATLGKGSPTNTYYMTRNGLMFFARHGQGASRWLAMTRIVLRTIRTVGAWTLRKTYDGVEWRRRRDANLLALRDFALGRRGPMGRDVTRACL